MKLTAKKISNLIYGKIQGDSSVVISSFASIKKAREWILNKFKSTNIRTNFGGGNYFLIWPKKNPKILGSIL